MLQHGNRDMSDVETDGKMNIGAAEALNGAKLKAGVDRRDVASESDRESMILPESEAKDLEMRSLKHKCSNATLNSR